MTMLSCAVLAALSVFDLPARQHQHEKLKTEFITAIQKSDLYGMRDASRQGVALLPEDPIWRYNLACALAKSGKKAEALEALDKAIQLGFRDFNAIANDSDFKLIANEKKFSELISLAKSLRDTPVLFGPFSARELQAKHGSNVIVGESNVLWDFDNTCFVAKVRLGGGIIDGNSGDLYINRDKFHSNLKLKDFPGVSPVLFESSFTTRSLDVDFPNMSFPYPVFGNCSRAMVVGPMWRSMPRALVTNERFRLKNMANFYKSNQIWVFPAVYDCPPEGKHGDVFASVTPYWIVTQGKSWSDQYYLRAALEISRTLKSETKEAIVSKGLLAPTVQFIIRKSLNAVQSDDDYFTAKAHPTAFPPKGLDMERLKKYASSLTPETIPPAVMIKGVAVDKIDKAKKEITYISQHAWAFVLRQEEDTRSFVIVASGADEFRFAAVHGAPEAVKIESLSPDTAKITLKRSAISSTNRVDIAVFGKNKNTDWGAPSFVSFAVVDPSASYVDPALADELENKN